MTLQQPASSLRPKPFSWSYSKLKNFESCPRRHQQIDLLKAFKDEESEALTWGNEVHNALEARISKGKPLPPTMMRYEKWAAGFAIATMQEQFTVRTELKLAFDRQFNPSSYFDNATWYRCKIDVLTLIPQYNFALGVDWKTGQILEDHSQLALSAQAVFSHYPEIESCGSLYVWLGDDARTQDTYTRAKMIDVWNALWPRVDALEDAFERNAYPPKPSGLCRRHCPVSSCEFYGKGSR